MGTNSDGTHQSVAHDVTHRVGMVKERRRKLFHGISSQCNSSHFQRRVPHTQEPTRILPTAEIALNTGKKFFVGQDLHQTCCFL
jgi:hypothetical protein